MASLFSVRGFFLRQTPLTSSSAMTTRMLSTTAAPQARQVPKSAVKQPSPNKIARKNRMAPKSENFARVKVLRRNMFSPAPPPLRMARQRYLRHWTIHRAWQLFRRQQHESIEKERMRMHAGMYNACEELRRTVGPTGRNEGYLYRVAMEKKGVYGLGDVPIEYARFQTDSPAKEAWNHGWKR